MYNLKRGDGGDAYYLVFGYEALHLSRTHRGGFIQTAYDRTLTTY